MAGWTGARTKAVGLGFLNDDFLRTNVRQIESGRATPDKGHSNYKGGCRKDLKSHFKMIQNVVNHFKKPLWSALKILEYSNHSFSKLGLKYLQQQPSIYSSTRKKLWLLHWGNGYGDEQKWLDLRDLTVWKQQCLTTKVIGERPGQVRSIFRFWLGYWVEWKYQVLN